MPTYTKTKCLLFILVVIGASLILLGAHSMYSDYPVFSTWEDVDAVVTHCKYERPASCKPQGSCSRIVNMNYTYEYNGSSYSAHCCGSDVRPSFIHYTGKIGGTPEAKIEILVNPQDPSQSRIKSTLFFTGNFQLILIGFLLLAFIGIFYYVVTGMEKSRKKAIKAVEPFMQKNGFVKYIRKVFSIIPVPKILGPAPGWKGTYRNREFNIQLFFPSGLVENVALRIRTPNKSGAAVPIVLNNKEQMERCGLGDIYNRLDKIGMLSKFWRRRGGKASFGTLIDIVSNRGKLTPWVLFNLGKKQAIYILPGSILTKKTFKESLDIICDTLDRLAI